MGASKGSSDLRGFAGSPATAWRKLSHPDPEGYPCPLTGERVLIRKMTPVILAACLILMVVVTVARAGVRSDVAKRLNHGLAGTPLAGYGWEFEAAGWRYNVSPFLVAAIAGTESSFGAAACGGNAWGINSCATSFGSFSEGLWYTTRLLRRFYIDLGFDTIWKIGARYAACGACWARHTLGFMQGRFGSGEQVTYPR